MNATQFIASTNLVTVSADFINFIEGHLDDVRSFKDNPARGRFYSRKDAMHSEAIQNQLDLLKLYVDSMKSRLAIDSSYVDSFEEINTNYEVTSSMIRSSIRRICAIMTSGLHLHTNAYLPLYYYNYVPLFCRLVENKALNESVFVTVVDWCKKHASTF